MKCRLFQFNPSKMGHLIRKHFPVLPISSVQQTVWEWQAMPQPRAAAEPLTFPQRELKMRVFLLETEWWHPDLSAQLLHPPLNWMTYQSSHVFLCRQLHSSTGRTEACSLVWRETGYFARCMGVGLVISLFVRLGGFFPWCQLSFPVSSGVLRGLPHRLTWKFCVRATLLLENLGHERHPLSLLPSPLVKISCGGFSYLSLQVTDAGRRAVGHVLWWQVEQLFRKYFLETYLLYGCLWWKGQDSTTWNGPF